tara:strand:- start:4043 stop:4555 length:513 start_codon:yes stop_codon:yes gene_type:complete
MKARLEKGKIVKYSTVPNSFKANGKLIVGGGKNLSTEELEEHGFLDVIAPTYDSVIEDIYNLHFDNSYAYTDIDGNDAIRDVFIYDKKDKTITETVAELKVSQIAKVKHLAYNKLLLTDWYAIRKAENETAIPSNIQTERDGIRTSVTTKEGEINALTTKASILKYDTNF